MSAPPILTVGPAGWSSGSFSVITKSNTSWAQVSSPLFRKWGGGERAHFLELPTGQQFPLIDTEDSGKGGQLASSQEGSSSPHLPPWASPLPIILTVLDKVRTKLSWSLGHWLVPKGQISPKIPSPSFISGQEENSLLIWYVFEVWTGLCKVEGIPGPHYSCPSPLVSASISLSLSPIKSIKSMALKSKLKVFLDSHSRWNFFPLVQNSVCDPIWVGCWLADFVDGWPKWGPKTSTQWPAMVWFGQV